MPSRIRSFLLQGVDALPCEIEVDLDDTGLERQTIVGLPDAAVRESMERVRAAMGNAGYPFPLGRTVINLAPATVRKEGPIYDLPIALGLLLGQGVIRNKSGDGLDPRRTLIAGELALDGRVRPVRGAIAGATLARDEGLSSVVVPAENAPEAAVVAGMDPSRSVDVFGVRTLEEVVGLFNGTLELEPSPAPDVAGMLERAESAVDFGEVRGQEAVKRAITVAGAGGHNLLMLCSSDGRGKRSLIGSEDSTGL